ncbi:MAG TPA: hypothetical protein VMS55_27745 [Myxococcota bacterium]|nr:hypothetical protein [Myxococcota bacterium]
MSWKQVALLVLLADFVAFTAYAAWSEGLAAFVPLMLAFAKSSAWGAQVMIDFLLAFAVVVGFVVADARRRGIAAWPFVALTLAAGSIGPLAYLLHRERVAAPRASGARAAGHA